MVTSPYQNSDGLTVKYASYYKDAGNFVNRPRNVSTLGSTKQLVIDYDLTKLASGAVAFTSDLNNDGTLDGFNSGDVYIPANASVTSVRVVATTAATGGTSFVLGTYKIDGTTISANSLITATEGVIANIATIGFRIIGAGALVSATAGTAGVGTDDAYIGLKPTGTFTAGKGRIEIFYTDPVPDVP